MSIWAFFNFMSEHKLQTLQYSLSLKSNIYFPLLFRHNSSLNRPFTIFKYIHKYCRDIQTRSPNVNTQTIIRVKSGLQSDESLSKQSP